MTMNILNDIDYIRYTSSLYDEAGRICTQNTSIFRFATVKYDHTGKNLWNPCMHLCNYSINKYHSGCPFKMTMIMMMVSEKNYDDGV